MGAAGDPSNEFGGFFCLTSLHCLLMETTMEKRHTIRMTEATAKGLKVEAAKAGVKQGELLEALLILAARGDLTDDQIAKALTANHMRGIR